MSTLLDKRKHEPWVMPDWLEPFRQVLMSTVSGGLALEDVMNDHDSNTQNNAYRALVCSATKSAVALMTVLYNRGKLPPIWPDVPATDEAILLEVLPPYLPRTYPLHPRCSFRFWIDGTPVVVQLSQQKDAIIVGGHYPTTRLGVSWEHDALRVKVLPYPPNQRGGWRQ